MRFEGRYYRIPEADIGPEPVRPGGPSVVWAPHLRRHSNARNDSV